MSKENEILDLLAVSSKLVGSKQVLRGLSEGTVRCVIVAEDADCVLTDRIVSAAEISSVPIKRVPSMVWLGHAAGIEVGAAAVGVTAHED